ncbi:hypothetical protein [Mycetocola saprophilus]|uniref:hypothetical protein n=1 Tax=Mycetocola saprophilus TaxID=76636 RepID=UPI0004C2997A|nr:hypothetical protein [Mycetocola saprophilus]
MTFISAAVAITATLAFTGLPAAPTDSTESQSSEPPSNITIDERTYGPEEGLTWESGSFSLEKYSSDDGPRPLSNEYRVDRGSSFVSSTHDSSVRYIGQSYAAGNVYQGSRYISAQHKYMRDGANVNDWQIAYAANNGSCNWTPGKAKVSIVMDTLNPWATPTEFRWDFGTVNPQVC